MTYRARLIGIAGLLTGLGLAAGSQAQTVAAAHSVPRTRDYFITSSDPQVLSVVDETALGTLAPNIVIAKRVDVQKHPAHGLLGNIPTPYATWQYAINCKTHKLAMISWIVYQAGAAPYERLLNPLTVWDDMEDYKTPEPARDSDDYTYQREGHLIDFVCSDAAARRRNYKELYAGTGVSDADLALGIQDQLKKDGTYDQKP